MDLAPAERPDARDRAEERRLADSGRADDQRRLLRDQREVANMGELAPIRQLKIEVGDRQDRTARGRDIDPRGCLSSSARARAKASSKERQTLDRGAEGGKASVLI